jgi:hypothetical protein
MRRFLPLWALSALAGCLSSGGEASRVEKVPEDLRRPRVVAPKVADRHAFGDVTKLRPGQWATYREGERTFTLAAVAAAGDSLWIELIEEGDPKLVSARLVGPDGAIRKAFYGEISKDGSKSTVEPQPLEQDGGSGAVSLRETSRETDEEKVTVAGRELTAKRVSIRSEDLEGRLIREVTLWHPDVPPVYAGSEAGGLIRKTTATSTVDLAAFGTDAKPQLDIPK